MIVVRVFFLDNEILIDTYPAPIVAASLVAVMNGDVVEIRRVEGTDCLTSIPWASVAQRDGTTFGTPDDVMAYLGGEFAKRRSVGEAYGTTAVAAVDIGLGWPVALSRVTGQLLPARADTYALSFVVGLTTEAVAQGFSTTPARGAVTLNDWTSQTGEPALHVGVPYFLAPQGGLTVSPFGGTGQSSTRVGTGLSPTTLGVAPADPILF